MMFSKGNDTLTSSKNCTGACAGSPQEVIERISAADPYFQPSSATVNPFNTLKLPAKSQLILQDGGRYCHSMPADIKNNSYVRQSSISVSTLAYLTSSETSISQSASPTHLPKPATCSNVVGLMNSPDIGGLQSCRKHEGKGGGSSAYKFTSSFDSDLSRRCVPVPCPRLNAPESSSSSARAELSSGGVTGGSLNTASVAAIPLFRRRGSGESGFFSVEDEMRLSFSELSSASFLSTEEDDTFGHPPYVTNLHRSPSLVTNSSEDLSSLGCGYDLNCDPLTKVDMDRSSYFSPSEGTATDIKAIVEFFERGYGSLRSMSEADRSRQLAANARRRECLVPLLRNRFSNQVSLRAFNVVGSVPHSKCVKGPHNEASTSQQGISPRCSCSKERCRIGCGRRLGKERPKIYITEGTVRAKRNIFESSNN